MDVVTFSGVTSGGIVTSGTTGWTCTTDMSWTIQIVGLAEARLHWKQRIL